MDELIISIGRRGGLYVVRTCMRPVAELCLTYESALETAKELMEEYEKCRASEKRCES